MKDDVDVVVESVPHDRNVAPNDAIETERRNRERNWFECLLLTFPLLLLTSKVITWTTEVLMNNWVILKSTPP